jgi:hypothetical protein
MRRNVVLAPEDKKKESLFLGGFIPAYCERVVLPGLKLFELIKDFYFTDSELREHINWIYSVNEKVAKILCQLQRYEEMTKTNKFSSRLLWMLGVANSVPDAVLIKRTKKQVRAFKNEIEPLINKHKALIDYLELKNKPKATTGKNKKPFCTIVFGAVLFAALIEALQYFLAGDCGFGLKQGVEMCVLALALISSAFSTEENQRTKRTKRLTQLAFAVFFSLSSLAPDLAAQADQLHLPILAVFAGFFLCQISLPSGGSFFGINTGGGVSSGRKAAGSMLASCGALALAYPLIKLWVQSGDNINQFAQTMFKAHCLEAGAAIAGIVLSLGILYSYSDEIRGGCYR